MTKKQTFLVPLLFCLLPSIALGEEAAGSSYQGIADVYRLGFENKAPSDNSLSLEKYNKERHTAGINDTVVVALADLKTLTDMALCIKPQTQGCTAQTINLYLDGKKIAERDPKDGALGGDPNTVEFDLKFDSNRSDLKNNWAGLLGSPSIMSGGFFKRPVKVTMGLDTGPRPELNGSFKLRRIDMPKFWICIGLLGLVVIIILRSHGISKRVREALSDLGPTPVNGFKPWSLARCQMAFWFVLVVVSFLSIWVVIGALDTITGSVLTLIGIGSGAALGSAMIDVTTDTEARLDELHLKEQKLAMQISDINGKLAVAGIDPGQHTFLASLKTATEGRLTSTRTQIQKCSAIPISQGFWDDVLSDHGGGSGFHRIQMVVWTLILGGIFVYSVWKTLSMPEFSETLLALQGISAGTYLGFKIPGRQA